MCRNLLIAFKKSLGRQQVERNTYRENREKRERERESAKRVQRGKFKIKKKYS